MASILDAENLQLWMKTKDAERGVNRPKSIVALLNGELQDQKNAAFDSATEFEAARALIIERAKNGDRTS